MHRGFIVLILSLLSMSAMAGGWSSTGGGELFKDAHNPWFLAGVRAVHYCIRMDQENFGASPELVERQIERAIAFWRTEFAFALPTLGTQTVVTARQEFRRIACGPDVDLVFQFGVLDQAQETFLKSPTKIAAITVRTEYSTEQLRGKGFIYVAPVRGRLAYESKGLVDDAWARDGGERLFLTLVHELGHIFGLSHIGTQGELMSEGFVEGLLAETTEALRASYLVRHFFSLPRGPRTLCLENPLSSVWKHYFDLKPSQNCLEFDLEHVEGNELFGESRLHVRVSDSIRGPWTAVGEATLKLLRFKPTFSSLIWLTDRQKIFPTNMLLDLGFPAVLGSSLFEVSKGGPFIFNDGRRRGMSLRVEQGKPGFYIDGVEAGGTIVPLL